jgi:glutathione S-transferase
MKLIGSVTSPYVRKVRVVMAEKKLDYVFELENVWGAGNQDRRFQPARQGALPGHGRRQHDVRLARDRRIPRHPDPGVQAAAANSRDRANVKVWEALADGVLDAAVLAFLERTSARRSSRARPGSSASWARCAAA